MPQLKVRPEAEVDALEAAFWYEGERAGLGLEFIDALRATFARIEEGPLRFPLVSQEFRRAIVHRFPFGVFFIVEGELVTVGAITHLHRIRARGKNGNEHPAAQQGAAADEPQSTKR